MSVHWSEHIKTSEPTVVKHNGVKVVFRGLEPLVYFVGPNHELGTVVRGSSVQSLKYDSSLLKGCSCKLLVQALVIIG